MVAFRVRQADQTDLQDILSIERESFTEPYPEFLIRRLLHECRDNFLVALDQAGVLAGYCVASSFGRSSHLISIAVSRTHRGEGVATALMRSLFTILLGKRVDHLTLEVKSTNIEAIRLYKKLGFEETGVMQNYYSNGEPAVRMKLYLPNFRPESEADGLAEDEVSILSLGRRRG